MRLKGGTVISENFSASSIIVQKLSRIYLGGRYLSRPPLVQSLRANTDREITTRTTRSGATVSVDHWPGADKRDFRDQVWILADEFSRIPQESLNRYKKGKKEYEPFDLLEVTRWSREKKKLVSRKIKQRELCAELGINISDLAPFKIDD